MRSRGRTVLLIIFLGSILVAGATSARESARGVVFDDANRNGVRDAREQGIRDIRVSNGREIVLSDRKGRYEIPAPEHGAIFVIQPPEWIAPLDEYGRPRFFYMHKPEGSPELDFMGSSPTGPLPASVDFPLHRVKAAREFSALFFGDTQPDDQRDIDFLAHDVVEELIGREAAFGVVLGDVLNDDLALFGSLCATLAALDVPMYYLPGNHDQNYDSPGDRFATETFEAKVGPRYFSFEQGSVHFIVLDNVHWRGKVSDPERWSGGNYVAGLDERQRAWLARDLELTPGEMLVVPMMHIPFNHPWIEEEKQALFRLLESRRHCFSMAAHAHYMEHDFVGIDGGWLAVAPHHQLIAPTACGGWWSGAPDEYGLPHTVMRDGAPNGTTLGRFDGADYRLEFLPARRPVEHQMSIWAPEEVAATAADTTEFTANIFAGSERSVVEFRLDGEEDWRPMERAPGADPYLSKLNELFEAELIPRDWGSPRAREGTAHIWRASLPAEMGAGLRVIEVRERDMFGQAHFGRRIIRIR